MEADILAVYYGM